MRRFLRLFPVLLPLAVLSACDCSEPGIPPGAVVDRPDDPDNWLCREGDQRCFGQDLHQSCVPDGEFLRTQTEDCHAQDLVCVEGLWCVPCRPGDHRCLDEGGRSLVQHCADDGSHWITDEECDRAAAMICHSGDCVNECDVAIEERSYVGCEFYAADLDNASITAGFDATVQQYAVIVSNPGDVPATVQVWLNTAEYGEAVAEELIEEVVIPNGDLYTFDLPQREIDGTPDGFFDWQGQSSGSALTGRAFRIASTHRVIAYQHNPLDNLQVFSNDSSVLLPTSSLDTKYVVLSWPQTIAKTEETSTNFCFDDDPFCDGLRTFLTVIGTADETHVTLTTKTRPVPLPQRPDLDMRVNVPFEVTLNRYEVLNLESDGFNADFTGSVVESDRPVVVFAGSEASDVPYFDTISERLCCADHLEEQMLPFSALGTSYAATLSPPRTPAVNAAGADVALVREPEWFRVMAVEGECLSDEPTYTNVTTTLPPPDDRFRLPACGVRTIRAEEDFHVSADHRIAVGQYVASQQVTGIPSALPGGDPAFIQLPPLEQWRKSYVFLVPELYAFDFMTVIAPQDARVLFDGGYMPSECVVSQLPSTSFEIYKCQLSFPHILPGIDPVTQRRAIEHVNQADGVHSITSDEPVGVILYGFDSYVSYGNAGGMDVRILE